MKTTMLQQKTFQKLMPQAQLWTNSLTFLHAQEKIIFFARQIHILCQDFQKKYQKFVINMET